MNFNKLNYENFGQYLSLPPLENNIFSLTINKVDFEFEKETEKSIYYIRMTYKRKDLGYIQIELNEELKEIYINEESRILKSKKDQFEFIIDNLLLLKTFLDISGDLNEYYKIDKSK